MKRICRESATEFEIFPEDLALYQKISPSFNGERYDIPPPTLCPELRFQQRLAFRNERHLYKRKCNLSEKPIISIFAPDSPYTVYDQEQWWSDKWEALDYGRDVDFSKTFTEQFKELSYQVPHVSLYTTNVENSYYTNYCLNVKDCYLSFGTQNSEACLYTKLVLNSCDLLDCSTVFSSELCYEGSASQHCYNCIYFLHLRNCSDCFFVENCQSCRNCLMCYGLDSKEYYILNEHVGKERFREITAKLFPLDRNTIAKCLDKLQTLKSSYELKDSYIFASEDCSGDGIFNSKNCQFSFDIEEGEDSKFIFATPKPVMSQDCTYNAPNGVQFCYNTCSSNGTTNSMATFLSWFNDSVFYTMESHRCKNLFGCIGLRNKQYCIFNKQYSKEDYEQLAARIVCHMRETGEWGEYFAKELSYFAYNETVADEYYPITKADAEAKGWRWREMGLSETSSSKSEALKCEATGREYRITPLEQKFYNKMGLPAPSLSPDERHRRRLAKRTPPRFSLP